MPDYVNIDIIEWLTAVLNKQLLGSLFILLGGMVITSLVKKIIKRIFKHQFNVDPKRQKTLESLLVNITKYIIFVISLLMILDLFGIDIKALLTSLGIIGLVVGLSLQDTAKDFIAGFSIIFEDQYRVGDNVTIGTFRGDVKSLGLKTTVLRNRNGEQKSIANRNIIEVINHSRESAKDFINLAIAPEADLDKLNEILTVLCEKLSSELPNMEGPVSNLGINKVETANNVFLISFKTKPLAQEEIKREIVKSIKTTLDEEGYKEWIKSIV